MSTPTKDFLAAALLMTLWVLAITLVVEFFTVTPSLCLPEFPYACPAAQDLNQEIVNHNLGFILGWPIAASVIMSGLIAWLYRNAPVYPNSKGSI